MADESSPETGRAIEAHAKTMTLLSREIGSKIDAATSKLGQQARMLKILVWLIAIQAGFGLLTIGLGPIMMSRMTTRTIDGIGSHSCQGRSNFRPLRRSKNRPVGGSPAVFVGRLERSLRTPFRAAQAEWKTAHKNRREWPAGQLEGCGRFFLLCLRR